MNVSRGKKLNVRENPKIGRRRIFFFFIEVEIMNNCTRPRIGSREPHETMIFDHLIKGESGDISNG